MEDEEKIKKICSDFSLLSAEQQDYILGILQALVFAQTSSGQVGSSQTGEAGQTGSGEQPAKSSK